MDDVSPELKAFLDDVAGKKPADPFVDELEEAVENARKNREWRHDDMTLQMNYQEKYEQGIEQGVEQEKIDSAVRMIEDGDLPLEKSQCIPGLLWNRCLKLKRNCSWHNDYSPTIKRKIAVLQILFCAGRLFSGSKQYSLIMKCHNIQIRIVVAFFIYSNIFAT